MIIIKRVKNDFKIYCILFCVFFYSCSPKKYVSSDIKCKVYQDNSARVSFSDDEKDLTQIELNKFYNENSDFDVIIYNHLEGSSSHKLQRFFKTKLGVWNQVKIENSVKFESEFDMKGDEVLEYLNNIEEKAFNQFCGICFDCKYYTFLIKKENIIFKYSSNGEPFFNIENNDSAKLLNYIMIYNFFKNN